MNGDFNIVVMAYCMKCRQKREIKDPKITLRSRWGLIFFTSAVWGTCPVCGGELVRIGKP